MKTKALDKNSVPTTIKDVQKTISQNDFLVSKTDTKGFITYFNDIFLKLSGYDAVDLIGANHNLIRHPQMPKLAFKIAWSLIKSKKEFFGFIKNLSADGEFYWVFAYISADLDTNNNIIGYTSFRRKVNDQALETIAPLYKKLIDIEKNDSLEASSKFLENLLQSKNMQYNEFIINLQKGVKDV